MVSMNINTILLYKMASCKRDHRETVVWYRCSRDSVHAHFPLSLSPRMGNQVSGALQCRPTGLAPLVGEGKAESL